MAGRECPANRFTEQRKAVPEPVAKLLRLCVKMKFSPEDVK